MNLDETVPVQGALPFVSFVVQNPLSGLVLNNPPEGEIHRSSESAHRPTDGFGLFAAAKSPGGPEHPKPAQSTGHRRRPALRMGKRCRRTARHGSPPATLATIPDQEATTCK